MAESDGKPASSPLSSEEADRLSEKFRPSWEAEPEPATIPKLDAPEAPPASPPVKAEPTIPIGPPSNTEAPTDPLPREPLKVSNPLAKQTMLGIAPPIPSAPPAATPGKAPDDLDWELPTNPAPTLLEENQPIEPPPKSNPSGVGQKYEPKDAGAPPIVLTDEVKRAEEHARAQLVAEHKARSAPTVLKFKAVEVPVKAGDDAELDFIPKKKGLGVWIGLGAGAVAVLLIGILVLARGGSSPEPEAPPPEVKAATPSPPELAPPPPPPVTASPTPPDPVAAPEPPASAPEAAPPAPAVIVEPVPSPSPPTAKPVPGPKAVVKPTTPPKTQKTAPAAPKPAAVSKPTPPAPKPTSPTSKPAPKPAAGGIVRDAPF